MSSPVTPGKDTSEFKETEKAGTLAIIGTVLGAVLAILPSVVESLPVDSKWAIIGGSVVICLSQIQAALVKLGYIQSRTKVKVEAEEQPSE